MRIDEIRTKNQESRTNKQETTKNQEERTNKGSRNNKENNKENNKGVIIEELIIEDRDINNKLYIEIIVTV